MSLVTRALIAPAVKEGLELQDVLLNDNGAEEAPVENHAVGVCHAELSFLDSNIPMCLFGHEGMPNFCSSYDHQSKSRQFLDVKSLEKSEMKSPSFLPRNKVILIYNYYRSRTT